MMEYLNLINQDPGYFCAWLRCLILFCLSVLCIRFTNHRFSLNTPLDFLIITICGGIISRGIVAANSLGITIEALLTLIILHYILSKLCFHYEKVGYLFKGCSHNLISNGIVNYKNMLRFNISHNDLMEQMRHKLNTENFEQIESATLERTGGISFIIKSNSDKLNR